MKTSPGRSRFGEARPRYDVTTAPKEGGEQPPRPGKPKPRSLRTIIGAMLAWVLRPFVFVFEVAWLWIRKPIILLILLICGVAYTMMRLRPATIDGPALAMTGWKATAYPSSMAESAIDGNSQTQWTTQGAQGPANWFAVDMKTPRKFHQIVMDSGADANAYPRGYAVYLSADGVHWGSCVARGEGQAPITIIGVGTHTARYVKVVQTRQGVTDPWSLSAFTIH